MANHRLLHCKLLTICWNKSPFTAGNCTRPITAITNIMLKTPMSNNLEKKSPQYFDDIESEQSNLVEPMLGHDTT